MDAKRFERIASSVAGIETRECRKSDIDVMVRLCNLGETEPVKREDVLAGIGKESEGDAMCRYYIVECGGEPVGCFRLWWYDGEVDISDLAVLPELQGQGIGTEAVRKAVDFIKSKWSGNRICLAVGKENHRARHIYDRLGFVPLQENGEYVWMELEK